MLSNVTCHVLNFTCWMSCVTCHFFLLLFSNKVVKLIGGGSVNKGVTPSSFPMYQILRMFPLPQLMSTNWEHLINSFFPLILSYRQYNYIYLVKNITIIDLLILGMVFFQHSAHNMMHISCNASYMSIIPSYHDLFKRQKGNY